MRYELPKTEVMSLPDTKMRRLNHLSRSEWKGPLTHRAISRKPPLFRFNSKSLRGQKMIKRRGKRGFLAAKYAFYAKKKSGVPSGFVSDWAEP